MSTGAFRANAPDIDIVSMERDLSRIPAVGSVRVVLDEDAMLSEVHVVCSVGRSPKLVGRDVQSLLAARWGIDVDHRKVSVVQVEAEELDDAAPTEPDVVLPRDPAPAARPQPESGTGLEVRSMSITVHGDDAEVAVEVAWDGRTAAADASGAASWSSQRELVLAATFDAFAQLDARLASATAGLALVLGSRGEDIALVTISAWHHGVERTVAGAAVVGALGELRAAADATAIALTSL